MIREIRPAVGAKSSSSQKSPRPRILGFPTGEASLLPCLMETMRALKRKNLDAPSGPLNRAPSRCDRAVLCGGGPSMGERAPVSCYIRTLNEERCIGRVIAAVRDVVSEIVVVDCGSTDATVAIAEAHGA